MSRDVRSALSSILVAAIMVAAALPAAAQTRRPVSHPAPATPYQRGYSSGYAAGYNAGQDHYNAGTPRDLQSSQAYQDREKNYDQQFSNSGEYREGYNLGLEFGYMDGYYGRPRNAAAPVNGAVIAKAAVLAGNQRARQVSDPPPQQSDDRSQPRGDDTYRTPPRDDSHSTAGPVDDARPDDARRDRRATADPNLDIPAGTQLNLRLTSQIDSKRNRVGDRFTAEVTTPGPYEGAAVTGHIEKLNPSGKVSGRTEMALAFDSITLRDGRSAAMTASLEKITESENVKTVDSEGNVKTGSRTKDSQTRGAIGGAAGAIIGGIAGGVKGAVLGAIIGGAAGVGTVYIEGDKQLILDPGTEMVIRTERTRAR